MARDPHAIDAKAYNAVVGRTTLTGIRLTEARFDLKPEALASDPAVWRKEVRAEPIEAFNDCATGRLRGMFLFELICRHKRRKVLASSATYLVSWQVAGECDEDVGALFVERVGKVVAYPYFRASIANLSAQAGVLLPPLPIISLAPRSVKSAADLEELHAVKGLSAN